MGTRSRVLIVRENKANVYLWQHWDGYLEGVGSELCNQMKKLLEKYNTILLKEMVENIEEGIETFSTEMLNDIIENNVKVQYDKCDDIEYEYIININEEYVGVKFHNNDWLVKLPFALVRQGYKFTDILKFDR
jgi:predicted nuclease with TOPRIM domain